MNVPLIRNNACLQFMGNWFHFLAVFLVLCRRKFRRMGRTETNTIARVNVKWPNVFDNGNFAHRIVVLGRLRCGV